jgi:glycosyltransferase involved in cell wall biosynthesis
MRSFELFEDYIINSSVENAKSVFGINSKRLIVCGYNAAPIVQHEKIIKVLVNLKDFLTDYAIIFPMTYGNRANITRPLVKTLLKATSLNYIVIEDYLPIKKLLALRLACDIFIHIQTKDQMASSMLEHLAAGSVVITGKWLPYESLEKLGVYFIQINKVDDLKDTLLEVITHLDIHLEHCKKNRAIILNFISWEKNKWSWYEAYNLTEK